MINNQNKNKLFLVIIAILVIANIAMLVFFLEKKGPDRQSGYQEKKAFISNLLQKEVGFTTAQLVQYDTLSSRHRQKVGSLYDNIRNKKTAQFKELAALGFSDSAINLVAGQSTESQKAIELNTFNHIKDIRLICTPEQLPKFDSSFSKVFTWRDQGRKKSEK